MLTFKLPLPPSANALTRNVPGRGRVSTAKYRSWQEDAGYAVRMTLRQGGAVPTGPLAIHLRLGLVDRNRDAGNCLKPIEDLLVKTIDGLPDDRWNDAITIERDDQIEPGTAQVTIVALADTS